MTVKVRKKGHSLKELFMALFPDLQADIQKVFESSAILDHESQIIDRLEEFDGVFEDVRYPFEDGKDIGGLKIDQLVTLTSFFGDYVGNLLATKMT